MNVKCIITICALRIWNYVVSGAETLYTCSWCLENAHCHDMKKLPVKRQGHILWDIGLVTTGAIGQLRDLSQSTSSQEATEINEKERKGHFVLLCVEY